MKFFKNKKLKILSILGASLVVTSTTTGFVVNSIVNGSVANNQNISNQQNQAKQNLKNSSYNGKVDINDNIIFNVANLDPSFADLYFSQLNFMSNSDAYASDILQRITNELSSNNGYWTSKPAGNFQLKVKSQIINDNSNPNITKGFANAIRVAIIVNDQEVDTTIISLVGFKEIVGQTYPIDTVNGDFNNPTNNVASFVYADKKLSAINTQKIVPPSAADIKAKLLEKNSLILNTIFANLPNAKNFTINPEDVAVSESITPNGTVFESFRFFDYTITLNKSLIINSGQYTTSNVPVQFILRSYVPLKNFKYADNNKNTFLSTNIFSKADITGVDNINSAIDFDELRTNDLTSFRTKIVELLKNSIIDVVPSTSESDISIQLMAVKSGSAISNTLGLAAYNVTLNKVYNNNNELTSTEYRQTFNIIIADFDKKSETKYFDKISVQSIDSLKNTFASQYASNPEAGKQLLTEIAKNSKSASVYKSGSYYDGQTGDEIAKNLFKAKSIKYDFGAANFDDLNGSISNINVWITGYYNANGIFQDNEITPKRISLTINGFNKTESIGVTSINNIDIDSKYQNYPAQSFLTGFNGENINPMQPTTPDLLNATHDQIKIMIQANAINLPETPNNSDLTKWSLSDLKINNFSGSITGKVTFPNIYKYDDNNNLVIVENTGANAVKLSFTIQGFSPVSGATAIKNFNTNKFLNLDDFDRLSEFDASTMTKAEFQTNVVDKYNNANQGKYLQNTIEYWTNKGQIFDNKWQAFSEQLQLTNITTDSQSPDGIYTIKFKAYVFDQNGDYKLSDEIRVIISGFKTSSQPNPNEIDSSILESGFNVGSLGSKFSTIYLSDIQKILKGPEDATKQELINAISESITTKLASNIDAVRKPVYKIVLDDNFPNPLPGYLYLKVNFKNNYYKGGNFIENGQESNVVYNIFIYGFKTKGTSTISPVISVKGIEAFNGLTAINFASGNDAKARILSLVSQNIANIEIKEGIENAVSFIWSGDEAQNQNLWNPNGSNGYYGIVNNIKGTIEVHYKFKANKWYKDGSIQTTDSELRSFTIVDLQLPDQATLQSYDWYNEQIKINVKKLASLNSNNPIASMVVGTNVSQAIQTAFKEAILSPNANPSFLKLQNLISTMNANLVIDYEHNIADNAAGTVIANMSVYGNDIFDPVNGLPYINQQNPYKFKIIVSGFDHIKPTQAQQFLFLNNVSNKDANLDYIKVKNEILNRFNLENLFAGTLPPGFPMPNANEVNKADHYKYIYLPIYELDSQGGIINQNNGMQSNLVYDFANGTITIKQLSIFYYIDSDLNLVKPDESDGFFNDEKVTSWENATIRDFKTYCYEEGQTPTGQQKYKYKTFKNITLSGFAKIGETKINKQIILQNENITAGDFFNQIVKGPDGKIDKNRLIAKLIYNKTKEMGTTPANEKPYISYQDEPELLPGLNQLNNYLVDYSVNSDLVPNVQLDQSNGLLGAQYNNLEGTITLNLVVVGNYYYLDPKTNKIAFQDNLKDSQIVKPLTGTVVIEGFKPIKPTVINKKVNLNNLTTDKKMIVDYVSGKNQQGTIDEFKKANLYRLIIENQTYFFKNAYNIEKLINELSQQQADMTDEKYIAIVEKYFEIAPSYDGLNNYIDAANFSSGTLTFDINLKQYYDSRGDIIDLNDPTSTNKTPLKQTVTVIGFNSSLATKQATNEIDLNKAPKAFGNLAFQSTKEELTQIIKDVGVSTENKNLSFMNMYFSNLTPGVEFTFDSGNVEVTNISNKLEENRANSYLLFTLKVKNAVVQKSDTNRTLVYGEKEFQFKVIGWEGRLATNVPTEWPISKLGKLSVPFDWTKYYAAADKKQYVQDFLTSSINGVIWKRYITNIKAPPGLQPQETQFKVLKIGAINPADPNKSMSLTIEITGRYDDKFNWISDPREYEIVITDLPVQKPTIVGENKIINLTGAALKANPSEALNILPSNLSLNKSGERRNLITFINTFTIGEKYEIIEKIFDNPYITTEKRTEIVGINVMSYDDTLGSAKVILTYKNYYNNSGELVVSEKETAETPIIELRGFNKAVPTSLSSSSIKLEDFYGNKDKAPEEIKTLTPSELVADIKRRVLSEPTNNQVNKFSEILSGLIYPIWQGSPKGLKELWRGFTKLTKDSLFAKDPNIISPGKIISQQTDKETNQDIAASLQAQFVYVGVNGELEKGDIDIDKSFTINDRLGTISFKIKVNGMWWIEEKDGTKTLKNASATSKDGKTQILDLTISGLKKNTAKETDSTKLIVIGASVIGGLTAIIILAAFLIKLKKFGTGGS